MKKIPKILSMVIIVGLIAAIPASTQILTGSRVASSDESNLRLLILVNRLELSEEQMDALDDILTGLIGQKDELEGLAAAFEQAMIEFNGTGEELDAMLVAFREEQLASAEALRESIGVSLDDLRDLLSINQGLILQEVFPQLMGGILLGADQSTAHRMDSRMPTVEVDRESRMSQRFGQTMDDEKASEQMPGRMGQIAVQAPGKMDDHMAGRTREDIETMMAQRFGQDVDDVTMSEQMRDRLEQLGDRVPEQMIERFGEASGRFDAQMAHDSAPRDIVGRGDLRQPGASSFLMQRGGAVQTEDGDLFGWLEQIANVLELKLEAMK